MGETATAPPAPATPATPAPAASVPATTAPATPAAPASAQPSPAAPGTPTTPPTQKHLSTRERIDSLTTAAKAAAQTPLAAPAEKATVAPSTAPAAPAAPGRDEKGRFAPSEAQGATETPPQPPGAPTVEGEAEQAPAAETVPDDPEAAPVPQKIGDALKVIADPKLRGELRAAYHQAKAYRELGMPISEAKERKLLAPTIESAREIHQAAGRAFELRDALVSARPEGIRTFMGALHEESPQAAQALVREVGSQLYRLDRQTWLRNAEDGMRNALSRMRQLAQEKDDSDYETAATLFEEVVFPGQTQGATPQRQRPANDPVVQRLQALEQREAAFTAQQRASFLQTVNTTLEQAIGKEADDLVKQGDPDGVYPAEATQELRTNIINRVVNELRRNPAIASRATQLMQQGQLDKAHVDSVVAHLLNQARGLLPTLAADELEGYGRKFGAIQANRQRRIREMGQPEVRTVAAPSPLPKLPEVNIKGLSSRQALDAYMDAMRSR